MIYVTSDLHGLEITKLKALLKKACFNENDRLFVLGDVIDRQNDGGVAILIWLSEQPNAQLILGNHEAMLLSCDFVFNEITEESIKHFDKEQTELLNNYMLSGGDVTLKALRKLQNESPETLCHSGLDNFSPERSPADYTADELIWAWPELTDRYFDDCITVFGHTPTKSYGEKYNGKILKTDTWIDVDVGVPYGNDPCLLRLDDLKEFYL